MKHRKYDIQRLRFPLPGGRAFTEEGQIVTHVKDGATQGAVDMRTGRIVASSRFPATVADVTNSQGWRCWKKGAYPTPYDVPPNEPPTFSPARVSTVCLVYLPYYSAHTGYIGGGVYPTMGRYIATNWTALSAILTHIEAVTNQEIIYAPYSQPLPPTGSPGVTWFQHFPEGYEPISPPDGVEFSEIHTAVMVLHNRIIAQAAPLHVPLWTIDETNYWNSPPYAEIDIQVRLSAFLGSISDGYTCTADVSQENDTCVQYRISRTHEDTPDVVASHYLWIDYQYLFERFSLEMSDFTGVYQDTIPGGDAWDFLWPEDTPQEGLFPTFTELSSDDRIGDGYATVGYGSFWTLPQDIIQRQRWTAATLIVFRDEMGVTSPRVADGHVFEMTGIQGMILGEQTVYFYNPGYIRCEHVEVQAAGSSEILYAHTLPSSITASNFGKLRMYANPIGTPGTYQKTFTVTWEGVDVNADVSAKTFTLTLRYTIICEEPE